MTNMAQLVTWMDATEDLHEREQLKKQLFKLHSMMLSAGLVLATRDPIVFRKLSIRWHHQQPHLDRVCPDVLEQIKPVLVRVYFFVYVCADGTQNIAGTASRRATT